VEVNPASKGPFQQSLSRLPASVATEISWVCADAADVSILFTGLLDYVSSYSGVLHEASVACARADIVRMSS
jgi:hypothetical protein